MKTVNIIQKMGITIGVLAFGIGFLLNSISPAKAEIHSNAIPKNLDLKELANIPTYSSGKYQCSLGVSLDAESDGFLVQVIILNTETGESRLYYGNEKTSLTQSGWKIPRATF